MIRVAMAAGLLVFGASVVFAQQDLAVKQDNLMKAIAKPFYGVLSATARGRAPYDQAAINTALNQLEQEVGKIAATYADNPKEQLKGAEYGPSQKVWQNKADFDSKIPPVLKAIADSKGKVKDVETTKVAVQAINTQCDGCHETYRIKLK